jgi:hypothetical protein
MGKTLAPPVPAALMLGCYVFNKCSLFSFLFFNSREFRVSFRFSIFSANTGTLRKILALVTPISIARFLIDFFILSAHYPVLLMRM